MKSIFVFKEGHLKYFLLTNFPEPVLEGKWKTAAIGNTTSLINPTIRSNMIITNEKEARENFLNDTRQQIYAAAVCDILDEMGFRYQAMHQRLRPLLPDMRNCGFIGKARTFAWQEIDYVGEEDPYGLEIEAMDSLNKGDVVVHSTDFNGTNAPWGELMSTIAKRKGVAGCVCDSQIRDCIKIIEMNFPVYYSGIRPLDSKGRSIVIGYDMPVQCGGVLVHPGDLIFADFDGVVVIPKTVDEEEVFQKAKEKILAENFSREALLDGKTLREVYDKYKAL